MPDVKRMSEKTVAVLTLISEGHSYSQIVDGHPGISYLDIFAAAEEALRLNESSSDYHERLAAIKQRYQKAYTLWTAQEDADLSDMSREASIEQLAQQFGRQPSAIRSRLAKLALSPGVAPPEAR